MKKKDKKRVIGISLSLLLLIGMIIYFSVQQTAFPSVKSNQDTFLVSQIANTNSYVQYTLTASPRNRYNFNNVNCNAQKNPIILNQNLVFTSFSWGKNLVLPKDIQYNKKFNTSISLTDMNGAYRPCTAYPDAGVINLRSKNLTASCIAKNTNKIECNVKGIILPSNINKKNGFVLLNAKFDLNVKFLKQGVECIDDAGCLSSQTCESNKCITNINKPTTVQPNTFSQVIKNIFGSITKFFKEMFI
ncbi:MAG: hypothetical protein GXO79_11505 [Chlorobi bacterium]|nr:hypothetical protein [Chlorobiota bacterium]